MIDKINSLTSEFFNNFLIKIDSIEVLNQEKNIFLVKINSPESGLIIGPNGKNLDHISNILKLIIKRNISEPIKIHLEVNDYIKSKDDRLKIFILEKIKLVEKNGKDLMLPYYSAYDRKKIHSIVADYKNDKIYTKSIGEGNQRRLYICKVNEKITIDLDGNDI
ncbi:MAG: hypothetical protein PHI37_01160 [Candidatus Gracilibacteria bacterium]|nr:hypothetical protein [Candidatus Gracilibacteria bacterium]